MQMSLEIKELRDRTGLSQDDFAEFVGIPVTTIRNWEQGRNCPPDYTISMLNNLVESYLAGSSFSSKKVIEIPDDVISRKSVKSLLFKEACGLLDGMKACLAAYYIRTGNELADNLDGVKRRFKLTADKVKNVTPILEEMLAGRYRGINSIFVLIYGVDSDEVYICELCEDLFKRIDSWDVNDMWNGCSHDARLFRISREKSSKYVLSEYGGKSLKKREQAKCFSQSFGVNMGSVRFMYMLDNLCELSKNIYVSLSDYRVYKRSCGDAPLGNCVIYNSDNGSVVLSYVIDSHRDEIIDYFDDFCGTGDYTVKVAKYMDTDKFHIEVECGTDLIIVENGKWYFL